MARKNRLIAVEVSEAENKTILTILRDDNVKQFLRLPHDKAADLEYVNDLVNKLRDEQERTKPEGVLFKAKDGTVSVLANHPLADKLGKQL